MPTWLTFLIALTATLGGLASLYFGVVLVVQALRTKATPRLGVVNGDETGTINVWVNWDPKQFGIEVYRLRFTHASPYADTKEGTFTTTFESPLAAPFIQPIAFPDSFRSLLERSSKERSVFTVEFKSTDEKTVSKSFTFTKMQRLYQGNAKGKAPTISDKRPLLKPDVATVLSLDFSELQARKKRIGALEAAAKAKAAKTAAAAPAPKPVAPTVAAPATEAPKAPPTAAPEAPKATPAAGAKSVRDVVSASNAKQVEKP